MDFPGNISGQAVTIVQTATLRPARVVVALPSSAHPVRGDKRASPLALSTSYEVLSSRPQALSRRIKNEALSALGLVARAAYQHGETNEARISECATRCCLAQLNIIASRWRREIRHRSCAGLRTSAVDPTRTVDFLRRSHSPRQLSTDSGGCVKAANTREHSTS